MPATPAWLGAVEAVLNRHIGARSRARALVHHLEGRSLQIDVEGVFRLRAACVGGHMTLLSGDDAAADAVIAGTPAALLRLMTAGAQPTGKVSVQVRGDAETAAAYRELLLLARPDLEEEVARVFGDLPARRIGSFGRAALSWAQRAGRTFGENVAEYLQEESRLLVNSTELGEFLRGVDELREAADRIAARVNSLDERAAQRQGTA